MEAPNLTELRARSAEAQKKLLTLLDLLRAEAAHRETAETIQYGPVTVRVLFCDGVQMHALWKFDGSEDYEFHPHVHLDILESIGLVQGQVICIVGEQTETLLSQPGQSIVIPASAEHRLRFFKGVPSHGWTVLVPPDAGLLPIEEGSCRLRGTPLCRIDIGDVCFFDQKAP